MYILEISDIALHFICMWLSFIPACFLIKPHSHEIDTSEFNAAACRHQFYISKELKQFKGTENDSV